MNRRAPRRESPGQKVAIATESDEYRSGVDPGDPLAPAVLADAEVPDEAEEADEGDDLLPGIAAAADAGGVARSLHHASVDEHGQRLDRALARWVPQHSRSHLQTLIAEGLVRVDGEAVRTASRKLLLGQVVEVELQLPPSRQPFEPEVIPIDIQYQDEHLLVLHKPAGLVVHPAAGNWHGTLLNGLLAFDPRMAALPRAGIVHRLDKDTSGLMVVARSVEAMTGLVRAIAAHEVSRVYLALAWGSVPMRLTRVDEPIGRDVRSRIRMAVRAGGKPARTDIRLVASGGEPAVSALECRLHTGRTHQIRVHLAHAGHPLVSDPVYGGRAALGLERQALHAVALGLLHPITGRRIAVTAPAPPDFRAAWTTVAGADPGVESLLA
jgi:23S rRNA pseudouridine1911/1915/1917 synthase